MTPPRDVHEWVSFEQPEAARTWVFDLTFLTSRWTCIYGRGCPGVLTQAAPELGQGCCSYGAHFSDEDDRRRVEAAATQLSDEQWEHAAVSRQRGGPTKRSGNAWGTRIVDGACIFLNRPGFEGGAGCALHLMALSKGFRPLDVKPDVCWQLPLRLTEETDEAGHTTYTLREWERRDWGEGGREFHWWCTEEPDAFVGGEPAYRALRDELVELVGAEPYRWLDEHIRSLEDGQLLPHPALRADGDGVR